MALVDGLEFTTSSTGESDHFFLGGGQWILHITSGSWGDATLQSSDESADRWSDEPLPNNETSITKNTSLLLPGCTSYRLNVVAIDEPIRVRARKPE